jgi:hypothetical protein
MHTSETLLLELIYFEVEIAMKSRKDINHHVLIKFGRNDSSRCNTLCYEIHKLTLF